MSSIDELKGYILYMKTKKLSRGLTDKEYVKYDQLKRELAQREKEAKNPYAKYDRPKYYGR